ncbi:MAG TPA: DUF202 domain-containing protein [Nitriliruptoraceae bacterium]|nr:DUF202 domain-containing protein [Nitriliruptoraceae bacterium]
MTPSSQRRPRWVYGVGSEPDPRFSLANERTLLSWMRTATGFAAGGGALLLARSLIGPWAVLLSAGSFMLSIFIVSGALLRWARMERALRQERALPSPLLAGAVAGALVTGAVVGLVFDTIVRGLSQ